ncbi:MAG: hypothetical protein M1822_000956 [Bathelium mastoideum]|nr:MAG: hypothetical protein M1822_000956 [Bathelium mastoideum]
MADHAQLVKTVEGLLAAVKENRGDQLARMKLLQQIDKTRYLVEGPMDTIFRQFENMHVTAALNVLTSTRILQRIPRQGTITAAQLAEEAGVDEHLVVRCMRVICVQGIGEEPEPDIYAHNAKSLAYIEGNLQYYFRITVDHNHAFTKLPQYLKTHTKEDLRDLQKSPYAWAKDREGMTYYQVISDDPERFEMFNKTLAQMDAEMPILGMFPFASLKPQVEAEPHRPCIVDVGGGVGRVLMSIQQEAPAGFGAPLILQDRPDVLASIDQNDIPHITKMEHDFFKPQPVKNAHVYLLRRILHDFYDPVCVDIVKNIANAMAPSSRLLVGDFVIPDKTHVGDEFMVYWMDLSMMMLTGREKTAKQFEGILDAAGLQLVKIWPSPFGAQAIIEAKLKQTE